MAKGNAPNFLPDHIACCRNSITPKVESRFRHDVSVTPAVQDDAGDVTLRVKSSAAEKFSHQLSNLRFVVGKTCGEKFVAARHTLLLCRLAWIQKRHIKRKHNRFFGMKGR